MKFMQNRNTDVINMYTSRLKLRLLPCKLVLSVGRMRSARSVSNDGEYLLSRAKQADEISAKTIFRVSPVPALDLEADISLPLRAYVLKCRNGKHYVGISPAHKIKTRIQGHFSENAMDASHFCAKNPLISVLCV